MFLAFATLITALSMASVAAWFAVAGIMAVFAGAPTAALVMGTVIEAGKIIGVSWVYQNWKERTVVKFALLPALLVAMLLTSMGIFGFLSKAHLEQTTPVGNNTAQIERLDQRINREQSKIDDSELIIAQLDETIQVLIDFNKISHPTEGSRVVRERQQEQRDALAEIIDGAEDKISDFQDEQYVLSSELRALELEVGPVKYLAALVYEEPEGQLENAVRMVIIAFIFVFDPMAILLLIAANYSFMQILGKPKPHNPSGGFKVSEIENPGEELINLFDTEPTVEPKTVADKEWLKSVPTKDQDVDEEPRMSNNSRIKNIKAHQDAVKESKKH